MSVESLESAFNDLADALATGDLDRFYGLMLSDAVIMDEDLPFRVDRAGFQSHISFHLGGIWEGFAWKPDRVTFATKGDSGTVAGFSMFRGKPRDAGFRLRPMLFSQGWVRAEGEWRLASWHQSPVVGHVQQQSPA